MRLKFVDTTRNVLAGTLVTATTINPNLRKDPNQVFIIIAGVAMGAMLVGAALVYKTFPELWNPAWRKKMTRAKRA